MTKTAEQWLALSVDAKKNADRCQVHTPQHTSQLAYAQLYAAYALYEQQRQTTGQ